MKTVASVVVTFLPENKSLTSLVLCLCEQSDIVIIVNNAPCNLPELIVNLVRLGQVVSIQNDCNVGIGAGQNVGIEFALEKGFEYVIVFDQDSIPTGGMIKRLVDHDVDLRLRGVSVAAVGPRLVDQSTGQVGAFIAYSGLRKLRIRPNEVSPPIPCFSLLASGTLFHRKVLQEVGLMNTRFFLEYVDVEWGGRARSKGYICYGIPSATLHHNLGDGRFRLPGGLMIPFHRPVRHYYMIRNAVAMQTLDYIPLYWKINDVFRTGVGFIIYSLFNPPRFKQLVMMVFGFFHGLVGRGGPWEGHVRSRFSVLRKIGAWASR